jgi:hypothetical protein
MKRGGVNSLTHRKYQSLNGAQFARRYLAGLQGLQCEKSMWDMRSDVIQIVRRWADDQDSDVPARHVLLIPNVLIYCDEDVKMLFSQGQQLPILRTAESCVSNGLTFVTAVG